MRCPKPELLRVQILAASRMEFEPERIGQKQDQERRCRDHEPETEPVPVRLESVPRGGNPRRLPRRRRNRTTNDGESRRHRRIRTLREPAAGRRNRDRRASPNRFGAAWSRHPRIVPYPPGSLPTAAPSRGGCPYSKLRKPKKSWSFSGI